MSSPPREDDPVLRNTRREAAVILLIWLAATTYCCGYCYVYGYNRPGRTLGATDLNPIWGIPSWFFWGVAVPWMVCAVITFVFIGFYMADDDLGADRAAELDADIREGASEHGA